MIDTSTKLRFVSELQTMLQRGLTHDIEHYVEILGIKCEKSESKNREEMLRDLRLLYSDLQNELYKLNTTYRGKQRN